MPELWRKTSEDYTLLLWKSEEPVEWLFQNAFLSEQDVNTYNAYQSEKRKREWLTVRVALNVILRDGKPLITYDRNGKPHIENFSISISHSHELIAILVSGSGIAGTDVELIQSRISRLAEKFLNEDELISAARENNLEKLHVMWGAKEVLFKIYSSGELIFKTDLLINNFNYSSPGILTAKIIKHTSENNYNINYMEIDGYMITWCVGIRD